MLKSPFINDPFSLVWKAFRAAYPEADCDCFWIPNLLEYLGEMPRKRGKPPLGVTIFPDDGSKPQVLIEANNRVFVSIEILAHELAHVAAGKDDEHGLEWENAFDRIFQSYNTLAEEVDDSV